MWMMCMWKIFHLLLFYEGVSTKKLWNKHELFYFFLLLQMGWNDTLVYATLKANRPFWIDQVWIKDKCSQDLMLGLL